MKAAINVFKVAPSKNSSLIEKVGVSDLICEDVSKLEFDENNIHVYFNDGTDEFIPLRSNDGDKNEDWRGANIFITRKFLEVDMTK